MDLNIRPDYDDIKEENDAKYKKLIANGFKNLESSTSQSFLSGMIGFDLFDNEECDETTEEDLRVSFRLF